MPSSKENPNRSESFGRLLKGAINSIATYEGRTAPVIEEELGHKLYLSGKTIQRYKAGHIPPEHETIKVFAEAAIQRGYLGRAWLERFLYAARYPFADKVLDQLCPVIPQRPRPPRVYENLPAPTYSQFVMRRQAFAEVSDGLQQRSAAVLIVGLGGNGKTSIAREVAAYCLHGDGDVPRFDAVVWVSDKDRPGTTNYTTVLDEIARTLDYPGFTQFEHEEKRREVEQLLRKQRVLVVIDNFETVTDGALLSWLLRLPEPSKALITSREYSRAFRNSTIVVDLRGMSEAEAWEFVEQRLRMLRIEKLVNDTAQLEPLLIVTGGNPKAIEIALGLVKHERRVLQDVVDDLYNARGELFDDLFHRAWALLDEAARRVLMVMTFFPASASAEALRATADVQGFAFDRAIERLIDLALLDIQQEDLNKAPRYTLHPLVRVFAGAQLVNQPTLEEHSRNRWVDWYISLIQTANTHWHVVTYLDRLDPEKENIDTVLCWTYKKQRYTETMETAGLLGYYYYVRGLWDKSRNFSELRLNYARAMNDRFAEAKSVRNILNLLIMKGELDNTADYVNIITEALGHLQIDIQTRCSFLHTLATYNLQIGRTIQGHNILSEVINIARDRDRFAMNKSRNWLAHSFFHQGKIKDAKQLFEESLYDSTELEYERSITFCEVNLAQISILESDFDASLSYLEKSRNRAYNYNDRRDIALTERVYGRYYLSIGNKQAAIHSFTIAADLYERLGMRRELAEARAELVQLNERMQAVP